MSTDQNLLSDVLTLQLVLQRRAQLLTTLDRHRDALTDGIAIIRLSGRNSSLFFIGNAEQTPLQ